MASSLCFTQPCPTTNFSLPAPCDAPSPGCSSQGKELTLAPVPQGSAGLGWHLPSCQVVTHYFLWLSSDCSVWLRFLFISWRQIPKRGLPVAPPAGAQHRVPKLCSSSAAGQEGLDLRGRKSHSGSAGSLIQRNLPTFKPRTARRSLCIPGRGYKASAPLPKPLHIPGTCCASPNIWKTLN